MSTLNRSNDGAADRGGTWVQPFMSLFFDRLGSTLGWWVWVKGRLDYVVCAYVAGAKKSMSSRLTRSASS